MAMFCYHFPKIVVRCIYFVYFIPYKQNNKNKPRKKARRTIELHFENKYKIPIVFILCIILCHDSTLFLNVVDITDNERKEYGKFSYDVST